MQNYADQISTCLSFALSSLEVHVRTLNHVKRQTTSKNRTVRLLTSLLGSIDMLERDLTERIEESSNQLLGDSAVLTEMIRKFQKSMPHVHALEVLLKNETARNCDFAKILAESEEKASIETSRKLKRMKRQLKRLITLLEFE